MDLPSAFFPSVHKHHSSQHTHRDYFLDYGSHENIDVVPQLKGEEGEVHSVTQKCHPGQGKNLNLAAVLPTLPLTEQPVDVPYPFQDRIGDVVKYSREKARIFVKKVRYNHGRLHKNSMSQFNLNMLEVGGQVSKLDHNDHWAVYVPPRLSVMRREYEHLLNNSKYIRVNSAYTGGCLCCFQVSGNTYLAHPTGEHFDTLNVVKVCREQFLGQRVLHEVKIEDPALEMRSSFINNTGYCCVRNDAGYSVYLVVQNGAMVVPVLVDHRHMSEDKPSSVCVSPYIPGEVLVSTISGKVHLSTLEHSVQTLLTQQALRFPVPDVWRQVNWAAHPRQFILADRTCVQLFDSRTRYGEGLDLFAQPTKLIHQEERVMVTKTHPDIPYYHFIATDFSLMMVDQRLPHYPVMLWPHSLLGAPQYLSPFTQDTTNTLVLLASQTPPETHCFHVQYGGSHPPQSGYQPWRLSPISDLTQHEMGEVFVDQTLLQQRFATSLAGMVGCQTQNSVHTYQLSSHGEVFYQVYGPGDSSSDKTCSSGPGGREILQEAKAVAIEWLAQLQTQFDQLTTPHSLSLSLDLFQKKQNGTALSSFPYVLCPLCMPQTCAMVPAMYALKDEDSTRCSSCGHSLDWGHTITKHTDKSSVVESASVHEDHFNVSIPKLHDLHQSSANTKILLGLWSGGKDIKEFVKNRDRERQHIREKKQEARTAKRKRQKSDKLEPSILAEILASSRPKMIDEVDDEQMECEQSKEERLQEDQELQTGLEKVRISPLGESRNSEQQRKSKEGNVDVSSDIGSIDKLLIHSQIEKFSDPHSDSDNESSLQSHRLESLTVHPGFFSTPPRLRPFAAPTPPPSPSLDLTDDEKEEEMFFSQEVRESLEMSLSLSTQSPIETDRADRLKGFSKVRKHSGQAAPLKKKKIVPGF